MEFILDLFKTLAKYIMDNPKDTILWFLAVLGACGGIPALIQIIDKIAEKSRPIEVKPTEDATCSWDDARHEYLISLKARIIERQKLAWRYDIKFHWIKGESYPLVNASKPENQLGQEDIVSLVFQSEIYEPNELPDILKRGKAKGYIHIGRIKSPKVKINYVGIVGGDTQIVIGRNT